MQARRVVVTGLGVVCPLGIRASYVWKRLLAAKCGVRRLEGEEFEKLGLPSQVAAAVVRIFGLHEKFTQTTKSHIHAYAHTRARLLCTAAR